MATPPEALALPRTACRYITLQAFRRLKFTGALRVLLRAVPCALRVLAGRLPLDAACTA